MFKVQNLKTYFITVLVVLILPQMVFAAELFIEPASQEVNVGEQFEARVFLNTKNEEVNAVQGSVVFPESFLNVKNINDGNSILSFWVEKPKVHESNKIIFAGIVPGGFQNSEGLLFSIIFEAKEEGEETIEIKDGQVLLNDGKGTPASLSVSDLNFSVTAQAPTIAKPEKKDSELPESFTPQIASTPEIFDGKYFLVFATQDKGSGIDRYEIQETRNKRQGKNWTDTESPYVLKDQELRSYIYVKAVDRAGNEKVAVVEPRYPIRWYENYLIWIIIILGVIVLCIIGKILWKKKIVH